MVYFPLLMAKGKTVNASAASRKIQQKNSSSFHWFDSFVGFITGVVFVFFCLILFFGFMQVKKMQEAQLQKDISTAVHTVAIQRPLVKETSPLVENTRYLVRAGDTIWDIAVNVYGDGYKYTDIIAANHLENPSLIFSGNVLIIPKE